MPYLAQKQRKVVEDLGPSQPGELNYAITRMIYTYMLRKGKSYTTMNEIVGALECAKHEFERRIMDPYENQKRYENGDVYV
jgi:hypothetical protein